MRGALLLSCELRCLNRWCLNRWCLNRRCLRRSLGRWCLNRRRLWLALRGSRLSRHVLLRFVLAARGPAPSFRLRCLQRPAQRVAPPAQRVVPPAQRTPAPLAPLVRSAPSFLIIRGQDKTRTTSKPDNVAVQVGQPEAHVPQGDGAPEGHGRSPSPQ